LDLRRADTFGSEVARDQLFAADALETIAADTDRPNNALEARTSLFARVALSAT
jgi:hypothetical protein